MKCSYCGSEAINVKVPEETINFKGHKVKLTNITYKHCTNPNCEEPDWLCGKEGIKRENQIREQLGDKLIAID